MLEALLDRIRGKKTAAEYDSAIDEINQQLDALRGQLAVHGKALTAAVFEATPEEVANLQAKRRATEDEISLLEAALEGAQARLDAAVAAERDDQVAELQARGRKIRAGMLKASREFDASLEQLIEAGRRIFDASEELRRLNAQLRDLGGADAAMRYPEFPFAFRQPLPPGVQMLQGTSPTAQLEKYEASDRA